jgi:hypothetical protein
VIEAWAANLQLGTYQKEEQPSKAYLFIALAKPKLLPRNPTQLATASLRLHASIDYPVL